MKKIFFFLSVVLLAGFSSCIEGPRGPAGRDGRDGKDGRDGSLVKTILDFQVTNGPSQHRWELDEQGQFYFCSINVPELTRTIYDDGAVVAYVETKENNGALVQQSLPRNIAHKIGEENWIEMLDFDYSTGSIIFYYTTSDFYYENWQPENQHFRVFLMW